MKRIEREFTRVEKEVYFEAWDGERFSDENACKEYENNARGVVGKKVQAFQVARVSEYDLFYAFGVGGDDYPVQVFKPMSEKDIESLNQYMNMFDKTAPLVEDSCIGQYVILNFNYEMDWVRARTLDNFLEEFKENFQKRILKEGDENNEQNM